MVGSSLSEHCGPLTEGRACLRPRFLGKNVMFVAPARSGPSHQAGGLPVTGGGEGWPAAAGEGPAACVQY